MGGEWITCNIVSDVYILTTGKKGINAERNENVKLTHPQVFCGRLCVCFANNCNQKLTVLVPRIPVSTKCRLQAADRIQNVD